LSALLFFFPFFLLPDFDLAEDDSTTWILVETSTEESPVRESGKVMIGEEFLEDFFLLLVLTVPIMPSAA